MLAILNSKYFLAAVIGLSVIVIIVGVLMVKNANEQAIIYAEQQKIAAQKIATEQEPTDDLVKQLEQLAASAQADLEASKSRDSQLPKDLDFVPEVSKQKVNAMVNKNPDIGSEDWCELLMVKPGKEWSEQDHRDFAKHCLD